MKVINIIACLSVLLLGSCSTINKKMNIPNDNIIEQLSEGAIEKYFNLPSGFLDFTPEEE